MTTKLTPKAPFDDLPVVESTSLYEVKKGEWVVLLIKTQGKQVIDTEILNEGTKPQTYQHAANKYKVDAATRFLAPQLKGLI
jgi:hypothetical protein